MAYWLACLQTAYLFCHKVIMLMSTNSRAARLYYQPNGFRMLAHGDHVLCAKSGAPIALEELRYWSVEHQEAYATCALAVEALTGQRPAELD